jgi:hypothetical protein
VLGFGGWELVRKRKAGFYDGIPRLWWIISDFNFSQRATRSAPGRVHGTWRRCPVCIVELTWQPPNFHTCNCFYKKPHSFSCRLSDWYTNSYDVTSTMNHSTVHADEIYSPASWANMTEQMPRDPESRLPRPLPKGPM